MRTLLSYRGKKKVKQNTGQNAGNQIETAQIETQFELSDDIYSVGFYLEKLGYFENNKRLRAYHTLLCLICAMCQLFFAVVLLGNYFPDVVTAMSGDLQTLDNYNNLLWRVKEIHCFGSLDYIDRGILRNMRAGAAMALLIIYASTFEEQQ